MDLINYLEILRRRWVLIVAAVLLALVAAWLTLPEKAESGPVVRSYEATATLIANPAAEVPMNMATAAVFATVGEVPEAAAKELGVEGDPQLLAAQISTAVDPETATMTITSTGSEAVPTAEMANTFAQELVAYFKRYDQEQAKQQIRELSELLAGYDDRLQQLDGILSANPQNSAALAEREGVQAQYATVTAQIAELNNQLTGVPPLTLLQSAVPVPKETATFTPPSSPRDRLLIGGILGLLLGIALALVVERVDSRLRTRDQTEQAFQLPVLSEIPAVPWSRRRKPEVLSATEPGSATAEAYRSLRSAVFLLKPPPGRSRSHDATVLLVTSARPGEGKTTTVANLAVAMAETGRRVLVLSLDFRNPRIQDYLGVASGSGLSDLLGANRAADLDLVVRQAAFAGVQVATSGQELTHPGALLAGVGPLIERARQLADIVLIDTAPLLAVSDAVDLSPHVDAALVVSRLNRTTTHQAAASQRLLSRLNVPALGAVLVGVAPSGAFDSYVSRTGLVGQVATRLGGNNTRRQALVRTTRDEGDTHNDTIKGETHG